MHRFKVEEKQISFETFQGWKCRAFEGGCDLLWITAAPPPGLSTKRQLRMFVTEVKWTDVQRLQEVNFSCGRGRRGEEDYLIVQRLLTTLWRRICSPCCPLVSKQWKRNGLYPWSIAKKWTVPLFSVGASNDFNVWIKPTSSLVCINPYKFGL